MVVSCERIEERYPCFKVTILFLDVTLPAQQGLGRVADRLELDGQVILTDRSSLRFRRTDAQQPPLAALLLRRFARFR